MMGRTNGSGCQPLDLPARPTGAEPGNGHGETKRGGPRGRPCDDVDVPAPDPPAPLAIVDVGYGEDSPPALAACVVAQRWDDPSPIEVAVATIDEVRPYTPGRFYERELPCVLAVLDRLRTPVQAIMVDGYAILDEHGTPGLGKHLHAALGAMRPVVGVAKTAYRGSGFATPVLRGTSQRPLYVTAIGIDVELAAQRVRSMHGPYRIPTLLGLVDHLARGLVAPEAIVRAR